MDEWQQLEEKEMATTILFHGGKEMEQAVACRDEERSRRNQNGVFDHGHRSPERGHEVSICKLHHRTRHGI